VNNPLGTKLYYSISEVAELTDLQPYTLRAWEKEFPSLRPRRPRGKNRAYRERDIGIILLIKKLLYEERYTTQGVKKKLRNEPELLRQIGSQVALLLDREYRTKEIEKKPVRDKIEEPEGGGGGSNAEFKAVVEEAKSELKAILQLL
jgi:DNA-binding transcriptional MerR regulator